MAAQPLIAGRNLPDSADLYGYFFQVGLQLQRAYSQGQLPFWNPSVLSGAPLLADPGSAALYPPNILLLRLLDVVDALRAMLLVHLFIAYLATYVFLRSTRVGRGASIYGAVSYAFSGYLFSTLMLLPILMVAALLPLLFALAEQSLRGVSTWRRLAAAVGLTFAVAFNLLIGFPQGTYYTFLALGAYVLVTSLRGDAFATRGALVGQLRQIVVWAALPVALGIAACSVQLVPALEFVRGTNLSEAYTGTLTNGGLLRTDLWALVGAGRETPENRSYYVGALALGLAALAVVRRPNRYTLFFGGIALIVPLLSTQSRTPVGELASLAIPGWASFDTHAPLRAMFLVVFALAVLGAWVLDRPRLLLPWLPLLAIAEIGVILLVPGIAAGADTIGPPTGPAAAGGLRSAAVFLATGTAVVLAGWTLRRWLIARRLLLPGLIALLIADLTVHDRSLQIQFIPFDNIFTVSPTADFLVQQRPSPFRIVTIPQPVGWALGYVDRTTVSSLMSSGAATFYGLQDAQGYNSLQLVRYRDFLQAINGPATIDYHVGVIQNPLSPLLRYLNVRFLVTDPTVSLSVQMAGWRVVTAEQPVSETSISTQPIDELVINSTLNNAARVPQGTPIGAIDVAGDDGRTTRLMVRAGIETADVAYDEPDVHERILHNRADVVRSWPAGSGYEDHVYRGVLRLPRPTGVTGLRFELLDTSVVWTIEQATSGQDSWRASNTSVFQTPDVRILETATALPRAFLTSSVERVHDGPAALARMQDPTFDPRNSAVLEEDPDVADGQLGLPLALDNQWAPPSATSTNSGSATLRVHEPNDLVVDVQSQQAAMLVLSEQFYPAWQAYVDGHPVHIYRADDILRAVALPAGTHTVEMRYESATFRLGLLISALTVLVLLPATAWLIWLRQDR